MRFPFLKVRRLQSGNEVIESRVLAHDLAEARSIFRPGKDVFIVSEASYRVGLPVVVPVLRKCRTVARLIDPLSPAVMREARLALDRQTVSASGKSGRPRGPRIEVTGRE